MGSSSSPYIFSRMLRPVIEYIREKLKVRIILYIDDFLVIAKSKEEAEQHMSQVLCLLSDLGWHINWKKSDLIPKKKQMFLGFLVDTEGQDVYLRIPYQKKRSIKRDIMKLIRTPLVPIRLLARIAGTCQSLSRGFAATPIYIRNLLQLISKMMESRDWDDKKILLPSKVKEDLLRWLEILQNWKGESLVKKPIDNILETDSSDLAWGAHIVDKEKKAQGRWNLEWINRHINEKELQAVLKAIRTFKEELRGKNLLIKIDNKVAMTYLNRMTGRIRSLAKIARRIFELVDELGMKIQAVYIPSKENKIADRLSREKDLHNWEISEETFNRVDKKFGPHSIDRFADNQNYKVKRFNSRLSHHKAEAIDALSQTWRGENNWIAPPFPLIKKVIQKLKLKRAEATVIVPEWRAQPWYQQLKELASESIWISKENIQKNNTTWKRMWDFRAFKISFEKRNNTGLKRRLPC